MTIRIVTTTFTATEFPADTVPGLLRVTVTLADGTPVDSKDISGDAEEFEFAPGVSYKIIRQRLNAAGEPLGNPFLADYTEPALPVMVDIPTGGTVA